MKMKKLILLTSILILDLFVNSQELSLIKSLKTQIDSLQVIEEEIVDGATEILNTASVNTTEAERIIDKYGNKVWNALSELANTLQVPAEHVYSVLVYQYRAMGTIDLILLLSGIFLLIIFSIMSYRFSIGEFRDSTKTTSREVYTIISGIIAGILLITCFFVTICCLSDMYLHIVNPEYYVIQDILQLIK